MSDPLLCIERVTRGFGPRRARRPGVVAVSLELRAGEIVGLVGESGSGKTTILQLIAGSLRPDAGCVVIAGWAAGSLAARRLVGFAAAAPVFPPGLTVRDALEYYARFHGPARGRRQLVAAALDLADLEGVAGERPARLPQSLLRRVALAQAALGGRRVLLLDETLDGQDVAARRGLAERLGRRAWDGAVIVLATHDYTVVERLADRLVVLRAGSVVHDAPARALWQQRVLEIVLDAPPAAPPPGFRVAPFGLEADLGTRTVEAALALCRAHRLAVRGTRVRPKSLEDVVVETRGGS